MTSQINTDNIRVYAQNCIRLETKSGTVLYFDPFHMQEAPYDADYVFFTHAHYDHFSPEDIAKVAKTGTTFIAPASMEAEIDQIESASVAYLRPGDTCKFSDFSVEAVPAYNIAEERLGFHPRENAWVGYVVTVDGIRYYIAGDTDHNEDTETVSCDVALVPIGGTYTMDPEQAAAFINTIEPRVVIPTHYGSIVGTMADFDTFAALVDPAIEIVRKLER